jgi:hypothetical protein
VADVPGARADGVGGAVGRAGSAVSWLALIDPQNLPYRHDAEPATIVSRGYPPRAVFASPLRGCQATHVARARSSRCPDTRFRALPLPAPLIDVRGSA